MTPREMEKRLLILGRRFENTGDKAAQAEYRALHKKWMQAKTQEALNV